jgi:uncharacterized protein
MNIDEDQAVKDFFEIIDPKLLRTIIDKFYLKDSYIHGVPHWSRVFYYGHHLSEDSYKHKENIAYFSIFHDSRRFNDGEDPEHGLRGADFFREFDKIIHIPNEQKEIIYEACKVHNYLKQSDDLSVGLCLDSDRLDLWRVGIEPNDDYLHLDLSKTDEMKDITLNLTEKKELFTDLSDKIIRVVYSIEKDTIENGNIIKNIKRNLMKRF